jgi:hypothetical protein
MSSNGSLPTRDQILVEALERRLELLVFPDGRIEPVVPLWHFTSESALEGILSNRCIWAKHYLETNDATELRVADDVIRVQAKELLNETRSGTLEHFVRHFDNARISQISDFFCASFSEDERVAAQWIAYGDGGRGVAIGFNLRGIHDVVPRTYGASSGVAKLIYADHGSTVRAGMTRILELTDAAVARYPWIADRLRLEGCKWLLRLSGVYTIQLKDASFFAEKECRLLHILPRDPQLEGPLLPVLRQVRAETRTVVEYPLCKGDGRPPITGVVVGPKATTAEERSIRQLVARFGGADIPVSRSTVPLR